MEKLHVITVISNPVRYKSRYKLYKNFEKYMNSNPNVVLYTAEMAYGDRPFEVTDANNPNHLQLRSADELWHKENMMNLVLHKLPNDWKYVAWVDADVIFSRPDWAEETIHQLQHYHVVQMFSECRDLDDKYSGVPGSDMKGMIWCHYNMEQSSTDKAYGKRQGHCGYAWAARRETLEFTGGFLDVSILGSGDYQMATAFLGNISTSIGGVKYHPDYIKALHNWGEKAKKIRNNVGYVEGLLLHNWHGAKLNRGYKDRWKILVEHKYNPLTDIERDWQGLYKLVDDGSKKYIELRDDLRTYFRARDEDNKRQR